MLKEIGMGLLGIAIILTLFFFFLGAKVFILTSFS
jgi:hypothetical protein